VIVCRPLLLLALLAQVAGAQGVDTTHSAHGASVTGVVRDSIARGPLAGAIVQLVSADNPARFGRSTISDSLGRFTLIDVPIGRYTIGFFHSLLDSLGVEAPLHEVTVDIDRPVRADLAIPSPARLRAAICGESLDSDAGGVVIGVVRDAATGAPAAGVLVSAEWVELMFRRDGLARRVPRIIATTGQNGWFAMCNVPSGGMMALIASRGADSTDMIEVQVPQEGFLRHELFIGPARTVVSNVTALRAGNVVPLPSRVHAGNGILSGTVVAAANGRPVADAYVGIADGPQTHANARGEWTLVDAPAGTRMLEVRALGYYPQRRRVDVVAAAVPIRVSLSTLKAMLDTVKITASHLRGLDATGFAGRRRSGVGRYLSAADIARRPAIVTSDIFRTLSGIRLGYAADTLASDMMQRVAPDSTREYAKRILIHGIAGNWCAATIYINGVRMPGITIEDIDVWVQPNKVAGIEIYSEASAPSEYQEFRSGCGSVVIWTKS
jgi:hypothetical protein